MSRAQKVMVTGGAGFIGSHLVERLLGLGAEVSIIDDLSNGLAENIPEEVPDWLHDGIESENAADFICGIKPDVLYHLAARGSVPFSVEHPEVTFASNVLGAQNVYFAAMRAGVRHVVMASSASWYGDRADPEVPKVETMRPRPKNHYAASKVFGEQWGFAFNRMHGMPFTALRFFNVFGERQRPDSTYAAVVPKFIHAALSGLPLELQGGGDQTRDLTYVSNVVDACLAVTKPDNAARTSGEAFNVCAGGRVSIKELAQEIVALLTDVDDVTLKATPARPGDIKHSFGDSSKLSNATGWEPRVGWKKGLEKTIEYMRG